jgi:opacity protein-like surface antigen
MRLRGDLKMTNQHTLKFSIFAAAALALCLPIVAAAQWGGYPDDRYPNRNGGYGRYDDRYVKDSVQRLDRLSKDFERDMDRALDRSRVDGTRREDQINSVVHDFRRAVGDLKSRVGNGRDLNRSVNEAQRVMNLADQVDRLGARRLDSRTASEWSQIQNELRNISDIYGIGYRGRSGDIYDRGGNRNNRNNDWWRRIPFPR